MTNPLAPLLRLLLRVFNVALAALALLLIGAALWMGQQYRHGSGGGDAPAPEAAAVAAAGGAATLAAAGAVGAAAASFPWFIYLVGGTGAYCLVTALCGLAGAKRDRRLHLATYILLLALLALAEAGATLLLLTDNSWRDAIPGGADRVAVLLFSCRSSVAARGCAVPRPAGSAARPLTRMAPPSRAMPPCRRPLWPLAPGAGVGGRQRPRRPPGGGGRAGR